MYSYDSAYENTTSSWFQKRGLSKEASSSELQSTFAAFWHSFLPPAVFFGGSNVWTVLSTWAIDRSHKKKRKAADTHHHQHHQQLRFRLIHFSWKSFWRSLSTTDINTTIPSSKTTKLHTKTTMGVTIEVRSQSMREKTKANEWLLVDLTWWHERDCWCVMSDLVFGFVFSEQHVDAATIATMNGVWAKVKAIDDYEEEAGSVLFQKYVSSIVYFIVCLCTHRMWWYLRMDIRRSSVLECKHHLLSLWLVSISHLPFRLTQSLSEMPGGPSPLWFPPGHLPRSQWTGWQSSFRHARGLFDWNDW